METRIKKLQEFYWSDADPDGRGFVSLADAYRRSGDPIEALRILRDGRRRHPELASGHVVAGWTHADEGDFSEAEGAFRTALEVDPQNVAALRGLADLLSEGGEAGEALALLSELQSLDPWDEELPVRIHDLQAVVGAQGEVADEVEEEPAPASVWEDPEEVAEELDWDLAALQADESEPEGDPFAGSRGDAEPDPRDSEGLPAASGMGEDALVTRTMGEVFLKQGLLSEAEGVFRELLDRSPGDEDLLRKLDRVQAMQRGEGAGEAEWSSASGTPDLIVPIEDLAPSVIVSIDDLAPETILPIEALAPDYILSDPTTDSAETWLDELP